MICLEEFDEFESLNNNNTFMKTHCFHYFHASCLGLWIQQIQKKLEQISEEEKQLQLLYPNRVPTIQGAQCPQCRQLLNKEDLQLIQILDKKQNQNSTTTT